MSQKCRFGYTERSCVEKDYPLCGDGDCELPSKSINRIKPKSYNEVHKRK